MGRTVLPYSHVWEEERQRWHKFRRALRREDQAQFDRLFELARLHLQAGVYASNPWPLESMLLSMLLEHQKVISALEERLKRLEQQEQMRSRRAPGSEPPLRLDPQAGGLCHWAIHSRGRWSRRLRLLRLNALKGLGEGVWGAEDHSALGPSPNWPHSTHANQRLAVRSLSPGRPPGVVVYHRRGPAVAPGG